MLNQTPPEQFYTVVKKYKFRQIVKMSKSLQASVGDIDPALFFIALIVAFIFAVYQWWSSDKSDNKGGLISEGRLFNLIPFFRAAKEYRASKKSYSLLVCEIGNL